MFVTPSFTAVREIFNINVEVLGGYFCSNRIQAAEQARLAAKILSGTPVSSVPIVESPKEYLYDWGEMQRLGISKEEVPTNVHIINMPISERYKIGVYRLFLGRDLIAGIDRLFVLSLLAGSKTKESGAR